MSLPSLSDRGSDTWQIRRAFENAYIKIDEAKLRADRIGLRDISAACADLMVRMQILREAAETERQACKPDSAKPKAEDPT